MALAIAPERGDMYNAWPGERISRIAESLEIGVRCNVVGCRPKPGKEVILVDAMSSISFDLGVTTVLLPGNLRVGVSVVSVVFFFCRTKICAGLGFSAPID